MSKKTSFKDIEVKHDVCRGKDSVKKICESFRQHVLKRQTNKQTKIIINKQTKLEKKQKRSNKLYQQNR